MKKWFVIAFLLITALSFAQQKYALVIGNGSYTGSGMSKLNNPVNDANDVAAALQSLGFSVDKLLNANLDQMGKAITRLKKSLSASNDTYGFFFYSGYGVQSGGVNYLIPVGANIPSENLLRERAISVQTMLDELNGAGNALNVVVLDACRDNPFSWKSDSSRGLAAMANQSAASIIVYAAGAGSTTTDGTGRNGLFTSHLLNNLKTPGLEVKELFNRTGADVALASNKTQVPAVYNKFSKTAYLGSRPAPGTQPAAATAQPQQPAPSLPRVIGNLVLINGGTFMLGSPTNEVNRDRYEGPQHQVTVSSFYMGKYLVTQKEYQAVMGTNPSKFKGDNLPVEQVSWFDAINYCNRISLRDKLTPAYTINGENVTWNQNANGYRLPTEAEWEYACRAGTTTPFSTGDSITTGQANYNGNSPYNTSVKETSRGKTTAVGSFAANPWGLYDMHGNVWEWCWDWRGVYSSGAETDPRGVSSGSLRVIRGGSWFSDAQFLRSAYRFGYRPNIPGDDTGFRVVRNAQ